MLGLPTSTELNKQLPKRAIYAKFAMKSAQQERFDADISRIAIVGEVSHATVAIATDEEVSSFFVVAVHLKQKTFDEGNIILLSKLIPQRILFVLLWEDKAMLATYHTKLLHTDWQSAETTTIDLVGLNLDVVWNNIITTIGSITLDEGNTIKEQLEQDAARTKLLKKIEQLEKKRRNEKQFNKQILISAEIKKLKALLN